ncbi:MAG: BolA/IbaG family iron-sulfur metabolism protein [Pseudomonadales bacterium]|nr:BolA/IbaG family iron-sulfur metabolism protein [Pseudomonadales bacterium]
MQDEITSAILTAFPDARVEVELDGNRALITVVSGGFAPMNRVQKQQAVYGCIEQYLQDGRLHAVHIRALTPDQVA